MTRESPYFQKCCFVVPLSLCLQTWAVIKILAACTALSATLMLFIFSVAWYVHPYDILSIVILEGVLIFVLCVDIAFNVFFMVAVRKKNTKYLRVSYIYDICMVVVVSMVVVGLTAYAYIEMLEPLYVEILVVGLLYITLDIFIILALKSEMIKLRNKEQYDFVKIPNSPSVVEDNVLKQNAEDS